MMRLYDVREHGSAFIFCDSLFFDDPTASLVYSASTVEFDKMPSKPQRIFCQLDFQTLLRGQISYLHTRESIAYEKGVMIPEESPLRRYSTCQIHLCRKT